MTVAPSSGGSRSVWGSRCDNGGSRTPGAKPTCGSAAIGCADDFILDNWQDHHLNICLFTLHCYNTLGYHRVFFTPCHKISSLELCLSRVFYEYFLVSRPRSKKPTIHSHASTRDWSHGALYSPSESGISRQTSSAIIEAPPLSPTSLWKEPP